MAAIAGVFALFLVIDPGGPVVSRAVVNLAWVVVSGGVAILMVRAARRCTGPARRAWGFLSASMVLWWGGQVAWTLLEEVAGTISPFPSPADIGFTAALPLGLVGVLSFPIGSRSVPARLRRATDALIAAAATFCLAWLLFLDDLLAGGGDPLERVVALVYPFATGSVASVVLMMLSRVHRDRRAVFGLLAAGQLANALCTTAFALQQLHGSYQTGSAVLEVLWLAGLCLMGAAAHRCRDSSDVSGQATGDAPSVPGTLLVYLPIAAAILAGVLTGQFFEEDGIGPPFVLAGVTVVVLMAVRQLLTIAENVHLARVVQTTADHYEALVRNSSDLVLVTDGYHNLVEISPSVERILGYRVDDVIGTSLRPLVHPDDISVLDGVTAAVLATGTGRGELRVLDARHHGWRWIDAMATNLLDDPSIGGVVVNARDTTDRHHAEEALSHQAAHDALTDLPNRSMLLARLDAVPAGAPVAVLFCDLDGFKSINDTYGHERGDEVLRAVAGRLRNGLRAGEMVARFGGDEFVILCEGVTEPAEATAIATRVADSLRPPITVSGTELEVSATIGARLAVGPFDAATVVNDADAAMYEAKARVSGAIEVFDDSLRARAEARRRTESAIREAIRTEGAIVLHYQPLWHITDGAPVLIGAEALLRWPGADGRLGGPAEVIGVAEETGLIVPLGGRILEVACRELARWHEAGARLTMAVNVSARQLGDPGLVADVEWALATTGAPPEALVVEVTETALMDDPVRALDTLRRLRGLGISLAIDDFGTGYCSLSYLSAFPVQLLKVDGTFVTQMTANQQDRTIVASVIGLAHALGIAALGEGVESEHQLDMLREMGCDQAQGFLLGVPGSGEELLWAAGASATAER
ncbi:EAL domain-containing protein [Iamia sp. SCSIO 61187]|uniref:putative bifunctional diguanylate cyclase/phosphodiesterase n=1 Tax=Iamia sp. SCSIO 61187 TaxID=2722752 RepID=UPI001C638B3D|nr:GGDEF domain-containing phosphodiesterase [Iamia sp. SCSIO 61187]QYG93110.1 EAL domain-containing protein [Iamia sp. SCSIO 61187]